MSSFEAYGERVNTRLKSLMSKLCETGTLRDAMSYSLLSGGKRLRPVLCLMAANLFGEADKALDFACAIEMIHTYSLIHDDLPAMDNDVLRRGKPCNHVVFGEGMALLAGDGLLNGAFEVMLRGALLDKPFAYRHIKAMHIVADAAGVSGMIAGQAADMAFEGKDLDIDALHYIHERKTAGLIRASVVSGAALMGASDEESNALRTYGSSIGFVFQIIDDILDVMGEAQKLGKTIGKDEQAGKLTFVRAMGIEASRQVAKDKTQQAKLALNCFGQRAQPLCELADRLLARDK